MHHQTRRPMKGEGGLNIQMNINPCHRIYPLMKAEKERLEKEVGISLSWPQVVESLVKRCNGAK